MDAYEEKLVVASENFISCVFCEAGNKVTNQALKAAKAIEKVVLENERHRIAKKLRAKGKKLNSYGDRDSVKIGEAFFMMAAEIERGD